MLKHESKKIITLLNIQIERERDRVSERER